LPKSILIAEGGKTNGLYVALT